LSHLRLPGDDALACEQQQHQRDRDSHSKLVDVALQPGVDGSETDDQVGEGNRQKSLGARRARARST
jgi:hypothetical protein